MFNFILFYFMKNLDLDAYGVKKMTVQEMENCNGGWIQFLAGAILGGVVYDIYKWAVQETLAAQENSNTNTTGYPSMVWR